MKNQSLVKLKRYFVQRLLHNSLLILYTKNIFIEMYDVIDFRLQIFSLLGAWNRFAYMYSIRYRPSYSYCTQTEAHGMEIAWSRNNIMAKKM